MIRSVETNHRYQRQKFLEGKDNEGYRDDDENLGLAHGDMGGAYGDADGLGAIFGRR